MSGAPPRLLCHGGTGDLTRVRIGAWPEVGRGALMDVHGLPTGAGRFHFGCGVLGGRPFLVFRERQNEANRSGYGYTMLLDPGDEVWERFGWNAALLLVALGEPGRPLGNTLRTEPEQLSAAALERLLESLPLPPLEPGGAALPPEAAALCAGVATSEAAGVLTMRRKGHPTLTPAAVARFLEELPACFRPGAGWLAGGSVGNAEAFGCRLLLDSDAEGEDDPRAVDLAIRRGKEVLGAWSSLRHHGELGPLIRGWELVPLPLWRDHVGLTPAALAERLVLAAWLGGQEMVGADRADGVRRARELGEVLDAGGVLARELSRLSVKCLGEGRAKGEERLQALLAGRWLDGRMALPPDAAARISPAVLVERLVTKGLGPDDGRVTGLLGLGDRATVWASLARNESVRSRLPGLVQRAIRDFAATRATKVARGDAAAFVLDGAFERSAALGGSLTDWESLRRDPDVGGFVRRKLRKVAQQAVASLPAGAHWFDRDDLEFTLEDAEEEAPAVVLALLLEGGPGLDERRRRRLRRVLEAGTPPPAAVNAFGDALARASAGGHERDALSRRFVTEPALLAPLLAAAGPEAAGLFVAQLAAGEPEAFERQSREDYAGAIRNLRRGGAAPEAAYTSALARFLRSPAARPLRERIAVAVHGIDASQIDGYLARLAGSPPAGNVSTQEPAGPGLLRRAVSFLRRDPEG